MSFVSRAWHYRVLALLAIGLIIPACDDGGGGSNLLTPEELQSFDPTGELRDEDLVVVPGYTDPPVASFAANPPPGVAAAATPPSIYTVPGVPWISQLFVLNRGSTTQDYTVIRESANCGLASYAMVRAYHLGQQPPQTQAETGEVIAPLVDRLANLVPAYQPQEAPKRYYGNLDGVSAEWIATLARDDGFDAIVSSSEPTLRTMEGLCWQLQQNNPVVVRVVYQNLSNTSEEMQPISSVGHFVVLVGIEADSGGTRYIKIHDPARWPKTAGGGAEYRRYTWASFENTWNQPNPAGERRIALLIRKKGTPSVVAIVRKTLSLPGARLNLPYSATLSALDGVPSYSWSLASGQLPPGLSLATNGTISGAPSQAGSYAFVVKVNDQSGNAAEGRTSITVDPQSPQILQITTPGTLPTSRVGTLYDVSLAAAGGQSPITWNSTAGVLPSGLALGSDGRISGTPSVAGLFFVSVSVTDSSTPSLSATRTFSLSVSASNAAPVVSSLVSTPTAIQPGGTSIITCNAADPEGTSLTFSWSASGGILSGSLSSPVVSWTAPSLAGDYSITCAVSDTAGATTSAMALIVVGSATLSDLVLQGLAVTPTAATPGGSAVVSFSVYNQASGSANPSSVNLRLSTSSSSITTGDVLLATVSVPIIAPASTYPVTRSVTIPPSASPGAWYVWIILDVNSTANQSNETNDRGSVPITVSPTPSQPDLIIQNLAVSPTSGLAGSNAIITYTVYNQGGGTAGPSTSNIRSAASSTSVTTGDPLLANVSVPSITAGGSHIVNQAVTIPAGTSTGTKYIWVIADVYSTAGQSDETNDKALTPFTVTTAPVNPQLTVFPSSGPAGTVFSYTGTGFTPNGGVTKHVRKPDGVEYPTVSFTANASGHVNDSYNSAGQTVYGTYYIWFVDNASGQSTPQVPQTITAPVNPQLTVTPSSGAAGTVFTYTGTGFTPNGGVTKHVRKPDGTEYPTTPLAANGSGQVNDSYNSTGQTVYGTYYIWFIDNTSVLSTGQVPQTITAPVNPQLTVTPSSGPAGTVFAYSVTGLTPNGGVTKHVRKPDGTEYPTVAFTANGSGQVNDSYNSAGQTVYGTYYIWFIDNTSGQSTPQVPQTITAPVNPQLVVSPSSGPAGTVFTYAVTGLTPNGGVTKHVRKPDGTEYPTVPFTANGSGQVNDSYNSAGQTVFGTYYIWFVDNTSALSTSQVPQTITAPVNPQLVVSPTSGPAGTVFSYAVTGLTPNGGVTKHVRKPDGTEYPTVPFTANGSGQVNDSYNSTGQTVFGTYYIWFVDNTSGLSTSQVAQTITAP